MNLRVLPIVLFFAFLLLPHVARFTGLPGSAPLQEYRVLASFPQAAEFFKAGNVDLLSYTRRLNSWYSDQFVTRPFWVRLHTQILYSVFNHSDELYVGKQNWLYYHNEIDNELSAYESTLPYFPPEIVERFARLSELLEQRGITLFVMPLAHKPRYYPEFLPALATFAGNFRFYDVLMDELVADGRVRIVDSRKPLEDAKAAGLKIYHQTDFHWTDPAGALAIKPVLQEIGRMEGMPELAESWDYDIIDDPATSGGQARALPLFRPLQEDSVLVQFNGPQTVFDYKLNTDDIEKSGTAMPGQPRRFSPVFEFGDSFFDAVDRSGFFNFFEAYARVRLFDNDLVEAYKHRQPGTRYMVIEFITSATYGTDSAVTELIAALEKDAGL